MPGFNAFDMDFDGHVDGIDLLGFDHLIRHVLGPDEGEGEDEDDTREDEMSSDPWMPRLAADTDLNRH